MMRSLVLTAIALGFVYSGWLTISRSAYFTVRTVKLAPAPHVSRDAVLEMAGLHDSINIFAFDTATVRSALLAHPWVANVRVKRKLPNTIDISIQERRPAGVLVLGELFLVDDEGRAFVQASAEEATGLPLITGLTLEDFDQSDDKARARVRSALSIARLYGQSRVGQRCELSAVHIAVGERMELMLGRTRVMLGRSHYEEKLKRLDRVLASMNQRKVGANYIIFGDDLRRVVVRETPQDSNFDLSYTLNTTGAWNSCHNN